MSQLQLIQTSGTPTQIAQAALIAGYLSNYSYLTTYLPGPVNGNYAVIAQGCPTAGCKIETSLLTRPPTPQQNTDTQFATRVDYTPREHDTIAVRYIHDRGFLTPDFGNNPSLPGFDSQQGGFSELAQVAYTHVFGPRILNEFRVSETRLNFLFAFTPQDTCQPA